MVAQGGYQGGSTTTVGLFGDNSGGDSGGASTTTSIQYTSTFSTHNPSSTSQSSSHSSDSTLKPLYIVLIVLGILVLLAAILLAFRYFLRWKHDRAKGDRVHSTAGGGLDDDEMVIVQVGGVLMPVHMARMDPARGGVDRVQEPRAEGEEQLPSYEQATGRRRGGPGVVSMEPEGGEWIRQSQSRPVEVVTSEHVAPSQ
ncbi:hypothetical protein MNV49_003007 [Pseudohyphozyma bogoriensis]|nr:hypothetical protein MNV49_003007 [Pseudohyphozyma bogoriensis]